MCGVRLVCDDYDCAAQAQRRRGELNGLLSLSLKRALDEVVAGERSSGDRQGLHRIGLPSWYLDGVEKHRRVRRGMEGVGGVRAGGVPCAGGAMCA